MADPYISNIQRFSLDDGPGIRTTVFFKGCNLRCAWCHNPECIVPGPTLQWMAASCTACGRCVGSCPNGVHALDASGRHTLDRSRCAACGACVNACPGNALKLLGTSYEPAALLRELLKDQKYYETSGGGATFSGGEPMLHPEYLAAILRLCREAGVSTAVDTAGYVPFSAFETVLPWTDLFLYDVKLRDSARHQAATGMPNGQILDNLGRLLSAGADVWIRTPVIPSYNDDLQELGGIAEFLAGLPGREHIRLIQLLPYHNYGVGKYAAIGRESRTMGIQPPAEAFLRQALQRYLELELPARIS